MADGTIEPAGVNQKTAAHTNVSDALYSDSYDTNASQSPTTSIAEDSAFRIMKDAKQLADAKVDQAAALNLPSLAFEGAAIAAGALLELPSGFASTALVVGGAG